MMRDDVPYYDAKVIRLDLRSSRAWRMIEGTFQYYKEEEWICLQCMNEQTGEPEDQFIWLVHLHELSRRTVALAMRGPDRTKRGDRMVLWVDRRLGDGISNRPGSRMFVRSPFNADLGEPAKRKAPSSKAPSKGRTKKKGRAKARAKAKSGPRAAQSNGKKQRAVDDAVRRHAGETVTSRELSDLEASSLVAAGFSTDPVARAKRMYNHLINSRYARRVGTPRPASWRCRKTPKR